MRRPAGWCRCGYSLCGSFFEDDDSEGVLRGVEVCSDGAKDSGDEPIAEGERHLGAAIGSSAFKSSFVEKKVKVWVQQVKDLAEVALTEPHAAFAVFTHCLQGRWTFLSRAMPNLSTLFEPLEDAIYRVFLSSLLRRYHQAGA